MTQFYLPTHRPVSVSIKQFGLLTILIMLFNTNAYGLEAGGEGTRYDLLLAGGGLKTCSSMSTANCQKNSFDDRQLGKLLYRIEDRAVQKLRTTSAYLELSVTERVNIDSILTNINAKFAGQIVERQQLRELFDAIGQLAWFRALPDPFYFALLDSLEMRQLDAQGNRKRELVALQQTKNKASIEIYQTFVEQARLRMTKEQAKPVIAVVTASSRDPFEVADFYLSVFEQAGAEVIWLPLDQSFQQARDFQNNGFNGCQQLSNIRARNLSFHRRDIYPERVEKQKRYCEIPALMLQDIKSAQGIFFNGGDQSLTLAALKYSDGSDSAELTLIKSRLEQGALIIGGTSAGTAVQAGGVFAQRPIAMITNGHSEQSLSRGAFAVPAPSQRCQAGKACNQALQKDDLTYLGNGGTGLFQLGMLDTHFSERDRETRLAVFATQTNQRHAFGVDEATALLSHYDKTEQKWSLEVMGQGGVFIVDRQISSSRRFNGMHEGTSNGYELSGLSHYLNDGDKATYDLSQRKWQFAFSGEILSAKKPMNAPESGEWRNRISAGCGSRNLISWNMFANQYLLKASDDTVFSQHGSNYCSYSRLPFAISWSK